MKNSLAHEVPSQDRGICPQLVHICGFPSSGTDLLANFMSAHPDIDVRGEFPFLRTLAHKYGPLVRRSEVAEVVENLASGDVYGNFANRSPALDHLSERGEWVPLSGIYTAMLTNRTVKWCGNKTPQNTENMQELLTLFPDTRFVFIVRDIRDVCVSWRQKWGKDMYLCAAKWTRRMSKGLEVIDTLPREQVLQVHFENLLADPRSIGLKISDFLGVPYDESFLHYHRYVRSKADGKKNFGKPIKPANREKWRSELRPAETRRLEEIALPMMIRLGYQPEFAGRPRRITLAEILRGVAVDIVAALIVGNRYRKRNHFRDRLRKLGISIRYRMPHPLF